MAIYDISQTIKEGIAVWPGDQDFRVRWNRQIPSGDSCNVSAVTMSIHTGTHMDAPLHFLDGGRDISNTPLESCVGSARVVEFGAGRSIDEEWLAGLDWTGVERVLFRTRSEAWPEGRFAEDFVHLTEGGAQFLGARGLRLVGTDAPSIDAFDSKTLGSHKILLSCGVVILEGLRLSGVPAGDYELISLPLKFAGLDGSPVRAILRK